MSGFSLTTNVEPLPPRNSEVPPDPEGKNEERAQWALDTVRFFQMLTGADNCYAIGDLLCDIQHMLDRYGGYDPDSYTHDLAAAIACAQAMYDVETSDKE